MINKIRTFTKTKNKTETVIQFDTNRDAVGVTLVLSDGFESFKGETVEVKYANNAVLTDLITFGKVEIADSKSIEIKVDTPVSVSHIFVFPSNPDIVFEDISVFESLSETQDNYYPAIFDTDLKENYYLDSVSVFTAKQGYSHYSVYTSLNGRDFDLLAVKRNTDICDFKMGDIYSANRKEARIIRVYIEYNSASTDALFDRIEFKGEKSGTAVLSRPEIKIKDFEDTEYNAEITENDTYNELYGIIERRLGNAYKNWFIFEIKDNPSGKKYDYFKLSFESGKVKIQGNNGVSLATGLNHYLKYYCKVNLSQVGDNAVMPEQPIVINKPVFKETKAKVRYAYNYCTLSYSMAFWDEKEWRDEIDWLALNGVNVVLDITAQEEVWRRFLTKLGYTHGEILKYIAGPAYYAWAYMANISGFGGPVHDSWFERRTSLARKNHLAMRKLGMYPVLQGYSGMVPNDICEHHKDVQIIKQGKWGSFLRPDMLRTTSDDFSLFAEMFYKAQREVYGDYSHYYATDPFHEGGNTGDMLPADVSGNVLKAMLKNDEDCVWIIQSWQRNPTSEFLKGLALIPNGRQHALVLDLYAEKLPNYINGGPDNPNHGYEKEFNSTPWVFCMLNNFGGRLGMHGHIDNLANNIPKVFNTCKHIAGIGITPEASFNNPVLYDFLFETVWQDNAGKKAEVIDLNGWICEYAERRYGKKSESAQKAWKILLDTVYKAEHNNKGQGAAESIVNARPSLELKPASSWGNICISYDKEDLKQAARLLLNDYELLKNSKGYKYDLVTVLQQILSNTAQDVHKQMADAFVNKDLKAFKNKSKEFLNIADLMEKITGSNEYYLLGSWVNRAKCLAENTDDFSKMLYEVNAKSLITTWGSYNQCETGGLKDYSNRQWSGLISDYYKPRWEHWINERIKELSGEDFEEKTDWFAFEWNWVRENRNYGDVPENENLLLLSKEII